MSIDTRNTARGLGNLIGFLIVMATSTAVVILAAVGLWRLAKWVF